MIVAGVLNTLGVWIRYGGTVPASPIYAVVLIGQILCAAAQTFILQVPPLIANESVLSFLVFNQHFQTYLSNNVVFKIIGNVLIFGFFVLCPVGSDRKSERSRRLLEQISISWV
jgi:hypothetical protein